MTGYKLRAWILSSIILLSLLLMPWQTASAATTPPPKDFSLQVTPSPLVTTVKPGIPTVLDLKVRNAGSGSEELKIEPRGFELDKNTGKIKIDDTSVTPVARWVTFSAPSFAVKSGEWYTEKVTILVPKEAGFSYSFVLILSRKNNAQPVSGGRLIKGSLAVFTLVNVDKPGATRQLKIPSFTSSKRLYEYLPTTLRVEVKNTGNSIVQPYGNIYLQRTRDSATPISTLRVNEANAYILPGTTRSLDVEWQEGFPVYTPSTAAGGATHHSLSWDWNHAADFRIGKYTAKLVAVYNDGTRDIPIEQEVSFWVIPWKAILLLIVAVVGLILLSRWRSKRRTDKAVRKALQAQKDATTMEKDS